jgi:hypothetical protein
MNSKPTASYALAKSGAGEAQGGGRVVQSVASLVSPHEDRSPGSPSGTFPHNGRAPFRRGGSLLAAIFQRFELVVSTP